MLDQSKLLELNPQLGLLNDIYQDTSNLFRESTLGNYIQIAVTKVFNEVTDKSLFSLDIENRLHTNELRLVLAANRHSYLLSLNLKGINHALDLSEDMGGVAHFLSDHVNTVDAVKIDCNRTLLATQRCANKRNICHISEDLEKLVLPAKHYDLIVIGELEALGVQKDDQTLLLAKLQASLSDSGVLIINVRNRQRISKWLDPVDDLSCESIPFKDLYNTDFEYEYDRKELLDTLASANFSAIDFNATLSKGDRCQNLFSEDYLCSNLNAKNHYYRLGAIENSQVNEYLLFKNLSDNRQRVFDRASRFIVFAGASTQHTRRVYNNDFSHYPSTGRKPQWRAITQRSRSAAQVSKTSIHPNYRDKFPVSKNTATAIVTQDLSPQVFHKGRLLIEDWIQAVIKNDHAQFRELIVEYSEYLHDLAKQEDFTTIAYDLLPFNIVLNERNGNRQYQLIDTEWNIDGDFSADFVVFRALFWFAFENRALLKGFAEHTSIASIGSFVVQYLPAVSQFEELEKMVKLEESLQSQISNDFRAKSVEHALLQSFNGKSPSQATELECQVLWGNADGIMDLESAVFSIWEANNSIQTLNINLPKYQAENPFLRIDPINGRGLFCISSMQLLDTKGSTIHKLETLEEVIQNAVSINAKATKTGFVALNSDPHLVFDFTSVPAIESATSLVLEICLLHDEHYDTALGTLSDAVGEQNRSLLRQQNTLNEYRSELEFTKLRLAEAIEHRSDLNALYQELDTEKRQKLHRLNLRVINLSDQLNAQLGRNQEMEAFLMTRPSTRAKRFAARTLARLTGKSVAAKIEPEVIESQEPETVEIEVDPNAFPQSGELLGQNTEDYQLWVRENSLNHEQIVQIKQDIEEFELKPVFSILVPIYNTDPDYLIPMIRSVQAQIYPHWQLCLVDDASPKGYLKRILEHEAACDTRISIQLNDHNQGIALTTNDALAMAEGDYIALLDHDDELSIDALYENAKAINRNPDLGLAYSDEDKMDMQGNRLEPYFKPDYSPDLLDTNNYVCHFTVIKKTIADEIGGFQDGLDGSQDHDIILRAIQKSERVVHIPKILYHWRKIPGSTAVSYDSKSYAWEAGRKAIEHCLNKSERGVSVEFGTLKGTYRVRREIIGDPLVSIIIPFKDKPELLDSCLESILNRSTYKNFEIIGVSNNSEDPITFERMQHFTELDSRITFVEKNIPFNFSAICNFGVSQASGEYSLLLNNDIEIITPGWIESLLEFAQRDDVGAVGGKLLFPDGRIQHAGVVAGMVGAAGHTHKFFPGNHIGYHGRLHMVNNVSAVTGAMLMLKTSKFEEVGGLDEDNLAVAYNDIDLCLKLIDKGYLNVFTPHCVAIHHESISRGYEDTQEKLDRLIKEQNHFLDRWKDFLKKGDPFYNPNLSLKNERFSLKFRD